ncbi:right-handed parallel beta-helix repeat-containing protein [Candidatus Bathyarchaeota archaeon]|nr:right-handed parallel beta-helix repeat-containing protein [Candidatus Bathyarchaeota archaeon]
MRQATATVMVVLLLIGMITFAFKVMAHSPEPKRARGYYPFELTFRRDLGNLTDSTPEIEELYIKSYLDMTPIALWAFVKFNYTQGLSDLEKIALQDNVQDELESKWYINFVERNYAIWIPEDPPPWPGFEIGALNVRFVSVFPVYTINSTLGYKTIQEAINANETLEGHTIFVSSGTYYENVELNKSVSLMGEDRETTIIDGNGTLSVLKVVADNVNVTNFTLRNGEVDGIFVENASHCHLKNNIIDEVAWGIVLENSNFTEVSNNNITGCPWVGISLESSNHNIISRNNITDNWSGIELWRSSYNNVSGNHLAENEASILYAYSDYNTFSENNIENTDSIGIGSGTSDYNNVFGNNITAFNGIWLDSSYGNNISGNKITGENTGIYLGFSDGNSVSANHVIENNEGMSIYESYYNDIYHNNFINNKIQVDTSYSVNTWDDGYPSGGNFWSNYNGNDLDHDGIGDIPFVIDVNNTDHYPLMKPLLWWNLADVNYDFKVDIYDVVLACSAYTSTPSDPHWNPHCDIAEPYGIIDIFDIVMIAGSYGEEYNP